MWLNFSMSFASEKNSVWYDYSIPFPENYKNIYGNTDEKILLVNIERITKETSRLGIPSLIPLANLTCQYCKRNYWWKITIRESIGNI
jgi:hypothetical protein